MPNYWLMKTETEDYSIDDLARDGRTSWHGVRNYQARNFMRDGMKVGDGVLIYHSSWDPTGVAGIAKVVKAAYPDPTALDKKNPHYDPKATKADPRWVTVDVGFEKKFARLVTLDVLKTTKGLESMVVTKPSRLSVQPVTKAEFDIVVRLGSKNAGHHAG